MKKIIRLIFQAIKRGALKTDEARVKILSEVKMSDTEYCYPDSDVLINKIDISDFGKLHKFERKLTMLRLLELMDNLVKGNFNFKHL